MPKTNQWNRASAFHWSLSGGSRWDTRIKALVFALVFSWVSVGRAASPGDDNRITVHPVDNGQALVNPDMGWTMHFYSNIPENYGSKLDPSDTLEDFPGLSTVYLRVPWAFVEPEEGRFNWALLDTPRATMDCPGKTSGLSTDLLGELDALCHP